jgi:hypothetical protein
VNILLGDQEILNGVLIKEIVKIVFIKSERISKIYTSLGIPKFIDPILDDRAYSSND